MITFPSVAKELIEERVKCLLGLEKEGSLGVREYKELSRKVKELSDYFTRRQEDRPDHYLGDAFLLAAYMAYFVPSNLLKIVTPLTELFLHPGLNSRDKELSLLDLGSGPGTASAGFIHFFFHHLPERRKVRKVSITAVDRVKENLSEAQIFLNGLWKRYASASSREGPFDFRLNTVKADFRHLKAKSFEGRRYDLILLSNALVETGDGEDAVISPLPMIEHIVRNCMKKSGSLIIIEPALRDSSRNLHMLRDEIRGKGEFNIYSPCLDAGPCGALINNKDWCHEACRWRPPEIVEEIDDRTAFEKSSLKFSYLVVRKDGLSLKDLACERKDKTYRVVSDLRIMKGEKKVFICGPGGRILLGRLNRHKSHANAAFDKLKRGDIVGIDGIDVMGHYSRIGRESSVVLASF